MHAACSVVNVRRTPSSMPALKRTTACGRRMRIGRFPGSFLDRRIARRRGLRFGSAKHVRNFVDQLHYLAGFLNEASQSITLKCAYDLLLGIRARKDNFHIRPNRSDFPKYFVARHIGQS